MKHEVPYEYELLMGISDHMKATKPPADLIEQIAYASSDEFFKKPKFWRCLIDYRIHGCYTCAPCISDAKKELYYIHLRMKKYLS